MSHMKPMLSRVACVRWAARAAWPGLACALAVLAALAATVPTSARAATASAPRRAAVLRKIALAEDRRDWTGGVLAAALRSADAIVRARAALAVGRLQDSVTVPAVAALLADRTVGVRREAVFALGQIGHASARRALEGALRDREPGVVALAVEALGKLGTKAATASLLPFVRRGTPEQRMRACESLWRLADTTAVGTLLATLAERDPAIRWRAVYALEKLPLPARIVPAVTPLLKDADPLVRAHAARTLGRLKSPLASTALLEALADSDAPVVVNAVRGLQLIADPERASGVRFVGLLKHRDPYVRVTAASALADSFAWIGALADSDAVVAALRHGMGDGDAATRGACGRALLLRLRLTALDWVRPLFADSVAYTRNAVVDGLRGMRYDDLTQNPPRVANALAGMFHVDGHTLVRGTAAEVAGHLIGRTHHPALTSMLETLRSGIDDRDLLVAAACAGALADAGDTASVPRLAEAYAKRGHDADADARNAIRAAIDALAGHAFADSIVRAHPGPGSPVSRAEAFYMPPTATRAVLHTSAGDIEWSFYNDVAPQTVKNFVTLAARGYFDSLHVHRVVPDFVIQDGDPTGTGSGGPGYTIRCEYNMLRYEAGRVGMALSGKDTGGSQWFITLSPQPHLNGRYTIFAHVTRGLEVAKRITQGGEVYRVEVLP